MGRKTYFGVPESKRPLPERFNVVLTTEPEKYTFPSDVIVVKSMAEALQWIKSPDLDCQIENVWIVGGHSVYKEAMESPECHRIYFTKIMDKFECDAFFPDIPNNFKQVPNDEDIPADVQEESGIKYQYQIFERIQS
jgi:dihydrofolate reductase